MGLICPTPCQFLSGSVCYIVTRGCCSQRGEGSPNEAIIVVGECSRIGPHGFHITLSRHGLLMPSFANFQNFSEKWLNRIHGQQFLRNLF